MLGGHIIHLITNHMRLMHDRASAAGAGWRRVRYRTLCKPLRRRVEFGAGLEWLPTAGWLWGDTGESPEVDVGAMKNPMRWQTCWRALDHPGFSFGGPRSIEKSDFD